MLVYERIDISDGMDINKSYESKECTLCHYWYFLYESFSYGPYLCDGCYNINVKNVRNLKILLLFILRNVYPVFFFCWWVNIKQEN